MDSLEVGRRWFVAANLAVRFGLELCAFAGLGFWGFHAGGEGLVRVALGIGAPLVAVMAWGMVVAPRARLTVEAPVRLGVEVAVFGSAVAGLAASGHPGLAWGLGVGPRSTGS